MAICLCTVFCNLCRAVAWSSACINSVKWSRMQFIWKTLCCPKLIHNLRCLKERKEVPGGELTAVPVDRRGRLREAERLCCCSRLAARRVFVRWVQSSSLTLSNPRLTLRTKGRWGLTCHFRISARAFWSHFTVTFHSLLTWAVCNFPWFPHTWVSATVSDTSRDFRGGGKAPKPLSLLTLKLNLAFWVVNRENKAELNRCVSTALPGSMKQRNRDGCLWSVK